ncbi:HD-GYP domain-containing protein [Paenibacillus sp. YN15]|uniref:HD-GYP domain-containing protein n=1 Tax=Paenibacillus sp. YN15 TaxID=1742774 RepID=UPI00215C606E|nr:HD-GYP domain-containing protein [Paenibacillus sp. YN15]
MNGKILDFRKKSRVKYQDDALANLLAILKRKHSENYHHSVRVGRIGQALAHTLKFSQEDQEKLLLGCLLHDIGKLMVPNDILDSDKRLTEDQWRIMKLHPIIGTELVSNLLPLSEDILGIIRHHHERWDGTGYPAGLKGEEIPLNARICAVADAFDSMVSHRPYNNRKSFDEALQELQEHVETQFDTAIVIKFSSILGCIRDIYPQGGESKRTTFCEEG